MPDVSTRQYGVTNVSAFAVRHTVNYNWKIPPVGAPSATTAAASDGGRFRDPTATVTVTARHTVTRRS